MVSRSLAFASLAVLVLAYASYYSVLTRMQHKRVWMTLLTNAAYLEGALTLDFSIKQTHSKYPLVVFHPSTLDEESLAQLHKRNIKTKQVDLLLPKTKKDYGVDERFYDCWSKLLPHGMVSYDRIVELDADMLVMQNIDELMEMNLPAGTMAATHACVCNPNNITHYPQDWTPSNCAYTHQHQSPATAHQLDHAVSADFGLSIMNGGLQVVDPSQKHFNAIVEIMDDESLTSTFAFADQSLLSHYFKDRWISLPYVYNALKTMRQHHAPIWRDDQVKVVHYILSDKPWNDKLEENSAFVPNQWWWKAQRERLHYEAAEQARQDIEELISKHKIVMFSKSYCGHSRAAKMLLQEQGINHEVLELDRHYNGNMMQQYLAAKTGQHTVPQTFNRGKFIGGNSDLQRHMQAGKLAKVLG